MVDTLDGSCDALKSLLDYWTVYFGFKHSNVFHENRVYNIHTKGTTSQTALQTFAWEYVWTEVVEDKPILYFMCVTKEPLHLE